MHKRRRNRAIKRSIRAGIAKIPGFYDLPIAERLRHLGLLILRAELKTIKRRQPVMFPYKPNPPLGVQVEERP